MHYRCLRLLEDLKTKRKKGVCVCVWQGSASQIHPFCAVKMPPLTWRLDTALISGPHRFCPAVCLSIFVSLSLFISSASAPLLYPRPHLQLSQMRLWLCFSAWCPWLSNSAWILHELCPYETVDNQKSVLECVAVCFFVCGLFMFAHVCLCVHFWDKLKWKKKQ